MSLRVALSGSAGTGKTSLGRALSEHTGLPFVEEGMRARIESGLSVHELDLQQRRELMRELWDEQRAAEDAAAEGFIADRSSYDYAAFWLHYDLHFERGASDEWMRAMVREGARYDRVLLLPWGAIPLAEDGVRSTNPWIQFRFQGLIEGVLGRFARRGQVLRVPGEGDVEERLEYVLRFLTQP